MATRPERYRWSRYGGNPIGEQDDLPTHHTLYLALGANAEERRRHYRELFRTDLDQRAIAEIRASLNKNVALGRDRFKAQFETLLGRRVRPAKMGRPRKHLEPR